MKRPAGCSYFSGIICLGEGAVMLSLFEQREEMEQLQPSDCGKEKMTQAKRLMEVFNLCSNIK